MTCAGTETAHIHSFVDPKTNTRVVDTQEYWASDFLPMLKSKCHFSMPQAAQHTGGAFKL